MVRIEIVESKNIMSSTNRYYFILAILIFIFGCLLRGLIISAPMTEDERKNVLISRAIDFNLKHPHLPVENSYLTHPLLNVYMTKWGVMLFGETFFGVRSFHLLFGCLTLWIVYLLARQLSQPTGLCAMFLLAVNQFHIHVSVKAENNAMLFFLITLAIYLVCLAVFQQSRVAGLMVGFVCGLAFLTKGVSVICFAAFIIFALFHPQGRTYLKTKSFWGAILLFLLTISPWILWIKTYGSSQLMFNPEMYRLSQLSLKPTAIFFYLIEPYAWFRQIDYRMLISWEDTILDGLSGIFLLIGIIGATRRWTEGFYSLMLIIFFSFMIVLSFFSSPGQRWGEFWWASLSLIPAICLTADQALQLYRKNRWGRMLISSVMIYLLFHIIFFINTLEARIQAPPHRLAAFADDDFITAMIYQEAGQYDKAIREMHRLLSNCPNDVDNLSYLGLIYYNAGQKERALDCWIKALDIEEDYVPDYNYLLFMLDDEMLFYREEIRRGRIEGHLYLAMLLYVRDEDDYAPIGHLKTYLQKYPRNQRAYYYLGLAYLNTGEFDQAIKTFNQLLSWYPLNERAHYQMGLCYYFMGQYDRSISHFKKALDINPDDARSYYYWGKSLEQKGDLLSARRMIRKGRSITHEEIKALKDLGPAYEE
jgi:4-amino-4-deoxy-L-arabinose transferase-like glycosyltransferase